MQPKIPLVHFASVCKLGKADESLEVIFDDMTLTLPTDRICGVLGHPGSGRTLFLRLISGAARPDAGDVISPTKFSVLCNDGAFFNGGLTGIANIMVAARLYGIDADMLVEIALGISNLDANWEVHTGHLPPKTRKSMELLVAALLPFECFLVDDVERVDADMLQTVMEILKQRGAGMIFTTRFPKYVRQLATCGSIIVNRTALAFESVEEVLEHYA